MRPSADTIRLFLEGPKQEVDRWLAAWVETQEATAEACGLYDWLAADPERRAKDYPGPMEKHRHVLTLTCWPEKSREAAVWLRNAGMIGEANMIDVELRNLVRSSNWPDVPRGEAEYGNAVDALHTAAKRINAVLTTCLAGGAEAASAEEQSGESNPAVLGDPGTNRRIKATTRLAAAMALVQEHPDWSDRQISKIAGYKSPSSLSRNTTFRAAAAMSRGGKENIPHGTKNRQTGNVEAWRENDGDGDS